MPTYRYRFTHSEVLRVKQLLAEGVPPSVIAVRFNVSPRTICYYKAPTPRVVGGTPRRKTRGPLTGTPLLAAIFTPVPPPEHDESVSP